ncbi:pectin lyase fold/virulence factor [Crassisporium funariophilum]|nr:pectin lyase fold/virulence factor [Crassisporium funariophilum]
MIQPSLYTLIPAVVAFLIGKASAVGTPFGLATGTTGGGNATPAVPSSIAQLTTWLSDSTARVILLDKIFDYTSSEGTTTGIACKPWTCSPNPQLAINANGWCDNYQPSAAKTTVTYNKAGTTPLKVGSNKTLLGKGSAGGIKGKGLKITGASNIIIQNIKITEINPQFVWGGDAIQIDGGSKIWIDHNTIQYIGRQMVVTGYGAVTATTISNNVFNVSTTHFRTFQITFVDISTLLREMELTLLFVMASTTGYVMTYHDFDLERRIVFARPPFLSDKETKSLLLETMSVGGHAIDPQVGSKVLLEGNYFNTVTTPIQSGGSGQAFAPVTSSQAAQCSSLLGRNCVVNIALSSGALPGVGTDAGTLNGFTDSVSKSASIMAASEVAAHVQANAGVGKVN